MSLSWEGLGISGMSVVCFSFSVCFCKLVSKEVFSSLYFEEVAGFLEIDFSTGVGKISLKKAAGIEPVGKTEFDGWSKIIGSCNTKAPLFRGASGGKFIVSMQFFAKKYARCSSERIFFNSFYFIFL